MKAFLIAASSLAFLSIALPDKSRAYQLDERHKFGAGIVIGAGYSACLAYKQGMLSDQEVKEISVQFFKEFEKMGEFPKAIVLEATEDLAKEFPGCPFRLTPKSFGMR